MKYIAVATLLLALLMTSARTEPVRCKTLREPVQGADVYCSSPSPAPRPAFQRRGLSAAEKDALDRAHARTLLDNIQIQLSRQRLGN